MIHNLFVWTKKMKWFKLCLLEINFESTIRVSSSPSFFTRFQKKRRRRGSSSLRRMKKKDISGRGQSKFFVIDHNTLLTRVQKSRGFKSWEDNSIKPGPGSTKTKTRSRKSFSPSTTPFCPRSISLALWSRGRHSGSDHCSNRGRSLDYPRLSLGEQRERGRGRVRESCSYCYRKVEWTD